MKKKFTSTHKWCPRCNDMRPNKEFGKNKNTLSGLAKYCKKHANAAVAKHYNGNPRTYTEAQASGNTRRSSRWNKENRERRRKQKCNTPEYRRQIRYGLTPDQYRAMWDEQKGLCKMPSCGNPAEFIDHDHDKNEVRALLCKQCNSALGFFRDRPELMREAADYVELFKINGGIPIVIQKGN